MAIRRYVTLALGAALVAALTACGTEETAPVAATATTTAAPAAPVAATTAAAAAADLSPDAAAARAEGIAAFGPKMGNYLDAVHAIWPLTDADRVQTTGKLGIGICWTENGQAPEPINKATIVSHFRKDGINLTQVQGDAIVDRALNLLCS
ncbi:hypothetical protein AB0H76_06830 [Nocardia sp. NPDC050712]|uniref:hypothetical protein n=1 Tax=Nocardia sp. NPDC050712 TaxID=3155518 RepID=UPI0033E8C9BC